MEIKYPKQYEKGNDFDTYDFGWMACWAYALKYFEKELDELKKKVSCEATKAKHKCENCEEVEVEHEGEWCDDCNLPERCPIK